MANRNLGKLQQVDLREVWDDEAGSFTPWLAKPESIALLGEALGMDLVVEHREAGVGPYRADIVGRDQQSDRVVLIENQIEETDHSHLGQILTYAAGLDAAVVVWIAKEFAPEHRAALDWLNKKAGGSVAFFGVEVEVLKIGASAPAPRFNVVCRHNEWAEMVRRESAGLTDTERLRMEYWAGLESLLRRTQSPIHIVKISSSQWQPARTPVSGYHFGFWIGRRDQLMAVSLGSREAEGMDRLKSILSTRKDDLDRELGCALELELNPDAGRGWCNACTEADATDRADWPRQHEWLRKTGEAFARVLPRYL